MSSAKTCSSLENCQRKKPHNSSGQPAPMLDYPHCGKASNLLLLSSPLPRFPQHLQHSAQAAAEERAALIKLYAQTSLPAEQTEIRSEGLQLSRLIKGYIFSLLLLNQHFCRTFSLFGVSSPLSFAFIWLRTQKAIHNEHKRAKSQDNFD